MLRFWKSIAKSSLSCWRCGADADKRDRFCRICGAELKKVEKEALRPKLRKKRLAPSIIALSLLAVGVLALISSIYYCSSILAFIGLGLTFWGALLLFIRPEPHVKAKLLDATAFSSLVAIDKILSEEGCQGKGLHLALKDEGGFKECMVFVPAKDEVAMPSMDELAGEKVFFENPKGVCLPSPGCGLTKLFEKELGVDFSKVDLDYLQRKLPRLLVEELEVLEDFSMNLNGDFVDLKMVGGIYEDLCREIKKLNKICPHLGCPISSAMGCVLAKATGKPVAFEGDKLSSDGREIQARFRIIKA